MYGGHYPLMEIITSGLTWRSNQILPVDATVEEAAVVLVKSIDSRIWQIFTHRQEFLQL